MNNHTDKTEKKALTGRRILILLAAVITALAVAVTCALCIDTSSGRGDLDAGQGEVQTSTSVTYSSAGTYNFATATTSLANNRAGRLTNGDVLTFAYCGSQYTVTLPKGTYTFSVWGAQGGSRPGYTNGGQGGYASGRYTVTAAYQTFYINVGGQGSWSTTSRVSGGYNGGGYTRGSSYQYGTGSGGGATHIATRSGLLSSLNSYRSDVKIVAGGGGGGDWGNGGQLKGGAGGGTSGGNGANSSYTAARGGSQTAGGSNGQITGNSTSVVNASFGQGASGDGASNTWYGGGGGGGWFGGGWGAVHSAGGGGSGYVGGVTSATTSQGGRSGHGQAQITAVNVNQGPETRNYTVPTTYVRGTNLSPAISIPASTIATDTDYANISGGNAANVYYTQGLTANNDTAPTANNGLYLNSACTLNANSYLTYSWSGNSTLNITAINRYPRAGVDGCTANGRFTLYTKVRDAFGGNTTRGVSTISFVLNVNDNALTRKDAHQNATRQYKLGLSTNTGEADQSLDYSNYGDGKIYNPEGTDRMTLFFPKALSPTDNVGYTVYASDLFADADTNYDKVAFKSITALGGYTSYSQYYTLTFGNDNTYASGLFPSFTIRPTGIRPTGAPYVVMTLVAQSSETNPKLAIGSENREIQVVFRISNTRPQFASTESLGAGRMPEPVISVKPGETKSISLNEFIYDPDDGANLRATFARDIKIPTYEYVQVDMSNAAIPLASNVGSNYYGRTEVNTADDETRSSKTGEGTTPTYFPQTGLIAAHGSNAASSANVLYRFTSDNTIEFEGRAATQNMYRTGDDGNTVDKSRSAYGHFYVLVRVIDPADPSDDGIWFPIALQVLSDDPTEPTPFANVSLDFNNYTSGNADADAIQDVEDAVVLTPLSYLNDSGELVGLGGTSVDGANGVSLTPFVLDTDGWRDASGALNDFALINGADESAILDNTPDTTGTFFEVKLCNIYVSRSIFSKIHPSTLREIGGVDTTSSGSENVYIVKGLAITPLRSTNGEYYQFRVKVKDSHGNTGSGEDGTVSIGVMVGNRGVSVRRDPVAVDEETGKTTDYPINGLYKNEDRTGTPYGTYGRSNSLGISVVNYTIERNDVIMITPYDYAYDLDTDSDHSVLNANGVYNTNPADRDFSTATAFINKTYSVAHTAGVPTAGSKTPSAVQSQGLRFANPDNIVTASAQYSNYIAVSVNNVGSADVPVPYITVTGLSRTTSAVVQIRFSVTDGFSTEDFMFTVTVLNAAPELNTSENNPGGRNIADYYRFSANSALGNSNDPAHSRDFYAANVGDRVGVAYDKDGDSPTFVAGSVRVVAYDATNTIGEGEDATHFFDKIYKYTVTENEKRVTKYCGYGEGISLPSGAENIEILDLSDYVTAILTKDGNGYDVMRVTGLSSTELFTLPVSVEFTMRDGFRAQMQTATLHLPISVVNSAPVFVNDELSRTENNASAKSTWLIQYEVATEIAQSRYIFNSRELYDGDVRVAQNGNSLVIPESNKMWLFDDYDAQQHVILNPQSYKNQAALVMPYDNRSDGQSLTQDLFAQSTANINMTDGSTAQNAAILYTPMYPNTGNESLAARGFVNISVIFYKKTTDQNGNVRFEPIALTDDVSECEYWAIVIKDDNNSDGSRTPDEMQIAIAVKDSHHGKNLYTDPTKTSVSEQANVSDLTVLNLFYNYKQPGILAMHTYYRTDANAEASVVVSGEGDNVEYLVDARGVGDDVFVLQSDANEYASATLERKQEMLRTCQIKDEFRYRYFEKTYQQDGTTYATYKQYSDSNTFFTYAPIRVSGGIPTTVPMSYLALPKGGGKTSVITDNHVTFENAGFEADSTLKDEQMSNWSQADVLANISLTDGTNTWSGATTRWNDGVPANGLNSNPYIDLSFVTNGISGDYINRTRFIITKSGNTYSSYTPEGGNSYVEDGYGFRITKKSGGRRATGLLRLSMSLKTTARSENGNISVSSVERVDVEIRLINAEPSITYYDFVSTPNQAVTDLNGSGYTVNHAKVDMTMSTPAEAAGEQAYNGKNARIDFVNGTIATSADVGKIFYNDPDSTDTVRFYMPSVFAAGSANGMSRSEIDHIKSDVNRDGVRASYYNVSNVSDIDYPGNAAENVGGNEGDNEGDNEGGEEAQPAALADEKINAYTYDPNPGYTDFFEVSPVTGATSSLQFVPTAKTIPNFPENTDKDVIKKYFTDHHLELDDPSKDYDPQTNKAYYPFRVLFYDECNGSSFNDGYVFCAIIRVYISNDPLRINSDAVDKTQNGSVATYTVNNVNAPAGLPASYRGDISQYTVNLSTEADFYIDASTLLTDNDIVITSGGTFATSSSSEWNSLSAEEKYIKDYIVMPDLTTYYNVTRGTKLDPLPISVTAGDIDNGVSPTTMIFHAKSAFRDPIYIEYRFADSNGSECYIVFRVVYNNTKPTPNTATFGGSNTVDITVMLNDTVYLYAGDPTEFVNDEDGGFLYYRSMVNAYSRVENIKSAAEMSAEFGYYANTYYDDSLTGNSLVLGSDDAASTLRISSYRLDSTLSSYLTVAGSLEVEHERTGVRSPTRLSIRARGVTDTVIPVTLVDGENETVVVNVHVTVLSTAPTAKLDNNNNLVPNIAGYINGVANPLTLTNAEYNADHDVTVYSLTLRYGDTARVPLSNLMTDPDFNDERTLSVYTGMSGNGFTVDNPGTGSVVSAEERTENFITSILITATDFINSAAEGEVATVTFRVKDSHNVVSSAVCIMVNVEPSPVTSVVDANRGYAIELKSFEQYAADGTEVEIDLVTSGNGARVFRDADASAPSALYKVDIFARIAYDSETGTVSPLAGDERGTRLYTRENLQEYHNPSDVYNYVTQFFTFSVSQDGKTLRFVPNAATIELSANDRAILTSIPLYVVVTKLNNNFAQIGDTASAQLDVSVADSKLMATDGTLAINRGYPRIDGELRSEGFLEFTGYKGDSLTWDMYNTDNDYLGLFYDYDMLNMKNGGKESIRYVDYSYSVDGDAGRNDDPVLSVSHNNGKVTITINRKPYTGQPNAAGVDDNSVTIPVRVYAADALNYANNVDVNDAGKVAVTTINVTILNDRPEIARTGIVTVCPVCGSESVHQNAQTGRTAVCENNHEFKSLNPERLGYTISYDNEFGYVMDVSLARGENLTVNIADIIDDADIDMDVYVMTNTGDVNSLAALDGTPATSVMSGNESLFSIAYNNSTNRYGITTLSSIRFTGNSTRRGMTVTRTLQFRDIEKNSRTSILTINLTVGNLAPTLKPDAKTSMTVMGVGPTATDETLSGSYVEYNILDFITDDNGDNYDASDETNAPNRATYTYIDEITVHMLDSGEKEPIIFGDENSLWMDNPSYDPDNPDSTPRIRTTNTVCNVSWSDEKHQRFRVEQLKGVYGVQYITLSIYDSGYEDGMRDDVYDGKQLTVTLVVTVANPLDDVPDMLEEKQLVYGVTRTVTTVDLLGEDNSKGYTISGMQEVGTSYLRIYEPGSAAGGVASADGEAATNWRIYAASEGVNAQVRVTFRAGDITRERILPIALVVNNRPEVINARYDYTINALDDTVNRSVRIDPGDWFRDPDAEDVMTFISPISSSQSVRVQATRAVDENGESYIHLQFSRRGDSVITVTLMDLSGRSYTYQITVNCTDAPELSWWENFMSLIEDNWMWFWIILACILLFIILLIIIIVVVHKKRKMRREIEALLESETELEEEMLRLSGGAPQYNSFGYLPPTQQSNIDRGMMLGGGAQAPQPNNLQLNAGVTPQTVNVIPPATSAPGTQPPPVSQPAPTAPVPPVSPDGFDPNDF